MERWLLEEQAELAQRPLPPVRAGPEIQEGLEHLKQARERQRAARLAAHEAMDQAASAERRQARLVAEAAEQAEVAMARRERLEEEAQIQAARLLRQQAELEQQRRAAAEAHAQRQAAIARMAQQQAEAYAQMQRTLMEESGGVGAGSGAGGQKGNPGSLQAGSSGRANWRRSCSVQFQQGVSEVAV